MIDRTFLSSNLVSHSIRQYIASYMSHMRVMGHGLYLPSAEKSDEGYEDQGMGSYLPSAEKPTSITLSEWSDKQHNSVSQ